LKVLLIVAGPGTGKTRTLVHRIAHLISERKIPPENILAATFTNKAAGEMKDRLEALLGVGVGRPVVGTFHALCLEILKDAFPDRRFSVLEENDRLYFVKEAVKKVKREYPDFSAKPSRLLKAIARAKQEIAGPDDDLEPYAQDIDAALFKKVYAHYGELLVQNRCLDFEDLLYEAVVLFESDPKFLSEIRNRFRFVFVDEYQDLNQAQYRIVRALAPSDLDESDRGLFVIGDPDQSIYGFRGSDVRFFQRFLEDYPGARAVYLNRNYRCTETILKASRQVIEKQRIGTETPRIYSGIEGVPVLRVVETPSDKSEAETVARIVEKLVGGTGFYSVDSGRAQGGGAEIDRSFSDIAVLFRTREQGRLLEDTFGSRGIPCQLVGKENLFGKEGAGELLSFLRVVHDAATYPDLERALIAMNPSIGRSDAKNILGWGVRNGFSVRELLEKIGKFPVPSVNEAQRGIALEFAEDLAKIRAEIDILSETITVKMQLDHLAKQTALKALIFKTAANADAFNKVLDFSAQFGKDIRNFLSSVALQTDPDVYFSRAEKVSLMTMHAAKGLEFPVVFVAGCEDGCIPFIMDNETGDPEEERRLFYVAMTRAKEELYLTWALNRTIRGKITNRNLSPFVGDIERNLKRHERALEAKKAGSAQVQLRMF
jgi:DNA helicase II / ATP-dependent DNA helicase PcrA